MAKLSPTELDQRQYVARNALATMRLEGLEPPQVAKDLVEKYALGALTEEQFFDAVERLLNPR